MSRKQLEDRLVQQGLSPLRAADVTRSGPRCKAEMQALASALNVRSVDLIVHRMRQHEEVVVLHRQAAATRGYPNDDHPAYRLTELARTRHQPYLKGFDMEVLDSVEGRLRHSLYEYIYNYGPVPVSLDWGARQQTTIEPCGSAVIRPFVDHRFSLTEPSEPGRLLIVRVPGLLNDDIVTELAGFEPRGRVRAARERKVWF
jgi:hypothetical protein